MAKVLVTGASGFVARHTIPLLLARGHEVRGHVRSGQAPSGAATFRGGSIGPETDWSAAVEDVDVVVHLAARVHQMEDDRPELHHEVNALGTQRLVATAQESGIKRFVYVSSVKALGEGGDAAYDEASSPQPMDAYGRSKRAAEVSVLSSSLDAAVLRPPVVYGPDVRANIARLIGWVERGIPLPLASVDNRRSLVYVGNLADAIARLVDARQSSPIYHVTDGPPVSTPELIRAIAAALDRRPRLLPLPTSWLRRGATLLGRGADADRLLGSLVVEDALLRKDLSWKPPYTMQQGLRATIEARRASRALRG